jgi:hypothetical protein
VSSKTKNSKFFQPIDRVALPLMLLLSVLIGILLGGGDRSMPYVRDFSWQDKQIGAADTFFILTFSRPMDHTSVEANLHIEPPLPGLVSWAGRRLVYTLATPAHYDTTYKVKLQKVRQSLGTGKLGNLMQPFAGQFRGRDRAFVYLGVEEEEKGRLILYNLTHKQKTILTPKNWVVTDFKPYPDGDRILFAASDWSNYGPGLFEQQLYTVTTGRSVISASQANPTPKAGKINQVLDNLDYHNLKFDLSADGQVIVVQRVNRQNLEDSGLWIVRPNTPWQPLLNQQGGEFLITPDSATLANTQGEGIAILPLTPKAKPLDFLPKFSKVFNFARDGVQAAMVKLNSDATQSLFLVTNQGLQKELLRSTGEFLDCEFDPKGQNLYCLITQLLPEKEEAKQLTIAKIDLKTLKVAPLLVLPKQWENIKMSLSPDGLALLFDQVATKDGLPSRDELTTDTGGAIATSHLFFLPIVERRPESTTDFVPHQELPLRGFSPRWLP